MKKVSVWNGQYKDIPFEINKFNIGNRDAWTFYLIFREPQFDGDFFESIWLEPKPFTTIKKRTYYDYNSSILGNLNWHGECTWYSKEGGLDGESRRVKAGCDYSHLFDENHIYDVDYVQYEVEKCIDSLLDIVTPLRWCTRCGDFFEYKSDENQCENCTKK